MSADGQGGAGRREVAYRLFAAEFDDATLEHSDSDEERAPNYVVTPTGARVNRLFVVGVLTEVESVSDDVLRARVVDPTGAFVVYAGQYQPDAMAFLDSAEVPSFVAVTGKARTYQPDGSERVFTSIRPETTNAVDADTRDRWTVQAAEQTLERVGTMAAALGRAERGEALADALRADGVDAGLAAGIPLAIAQYGTTPAYLTGLRRIAIQAADIVAGERDEVEPLAVDPDSDGTGTLELEELIASAELDDTPATADPPAQAVGEVGTSAGEAATGSVSPTTSVSTERPVSDRAAEPADAAATEPPDDATDDSPGHGVEDPAADESDEAFELDQSARDQIEDTYGTEFQAGSEVDEPGQADIDTASEAPAVEADSQVEDGDGPDPSGSATSGEVASDPDVAGAETAAPEPTGDETSGSTAEPSPETEEVEESESDAGETALEDLEAAVVEAMRERDDGDGADRAAVIDAVATSYDIDAAEVEAAIEDALMAGKCYEPAEGRLKAI